MQQLALRFGFDHKLYFFKTSNKYTLHKQSLSLSKQKHQVVLQELNSASNPLLFSVQLNLWVDLFLAVVVLNSFWDLMLTLWEFPNMQHADLYNGAASMLIKVCQGSKELVVEDESVCSIWITCQRQPGKQQTWQSTKVVSGMKKKSCLAKFSTNLNCTLAWLNSSLLRTNSAKNWKWEPLWEEACWEQVRIERAPVAVLSCPLSCSWCQQHSFHHFHLELQQVTKTIWNPTQATCFKCFFLMLENTHKEVLILGSKLDQSSSLVSIKEKSQKESSEKIAANLSSGSAFFVGLHGKGHVCILSQLLKRSTICTAPWEARL